MSFQVDTAMVETFRSNVEIKFQQKGSRLRSCVRNETQNSEFDFYDRILATAATKSDTRHSDTPLISTPHDRRRVGLNKYHWADLIDNYDKARMLINPDNAYATNASLALGRSMDDEIILAATGPAYAGKQGNDVIAHPAGQRVAVNFTYSSPANTNLTIDKLLRAKDILGTAEAFQEGDELICALTQSQLTSLLRTTAVTSADFNTVKALVNGEVDTFVGFKFVQTQRLLKAGNNRSILCYVKPGILLTMNSDIAVRMTERADKNYSLQVYVEGTFGATRMWEEQVVEVLCDETV